MRNPSGYGVYTDRLQERKPVEYDTLTCGHCQRIVFVKPGSAGTIYLVVDRAATTFREEPGAFCRVCMRPVCLPCHDVGRCTPWEQKIEASEARERFLQAAGIRG